jgi:DNA-binding NarL/FixJ family response regulator
MPLNTSCRRQYQGSHESIMHRVSILIVDDHPLVRSGLHELMKHEPDLEVCCEAASLQEAVQFLGHHSPDVAILDISLPDGNGLDLIKRLRIRNPETRILVLSMHDETLLAERALRAGALGYINKEEAAENIVAAIRQILKGKIWMSQRMTEHLLRMGAPGTSESFNSPVDCLSDRELEVFELIGRGLGTGDIAGRLHLSVKTIETHRANIKKKLYIDTGSELTRRAMQWSLDHQ